MDIIIYERVKYMTQASYKYIGNVLDRNTRGWLPVVDEHSNKFYLPLLTKVEKLENANLFVMEGIHKGKTITVDHKRIKPNIYSSYLFNSFTYAEGANLKLILKTSILQFPTQEEKVMCEGILPGVYKILLPDRPHEKKMQEDYYDESNSSGSRFCTTWFPIDTPQHNQYLHMGEYSTGCVTVLDNWQRIYLSLIHSRESESVIGTLTVVEE